MRIYPIIVAALVVLAGCSGVLGGGSDEPVETFTPVPEPTPKPTPTPVPQLAPGLTGQGIENVNALVAAHTSFLQNRSFTKTINVTALASNGTVLIRSTSTLRAGPDGERIYSVSKRNGTIFEMVIRTESWSNGERVFSKRVYANGTTTYDQYRRRGFGSGAGLRYRFEPFGSANTSVVKQFTENGTTLYRVRGATRTKKIFGNVSLRLRLVVDSRGVIHEYRIIRRLPSKGNISKTIFEVEFSKIGATDAPERPSWVDEALNRTTPIQPVETTRGSE